MKKYIVALDEGTTSARTIVFDHDGSVVASAQREFALQYPQPGWVEMDADEVYDCQYATLIEAVHGIDPREIAAVAIANQRETTIVWDKNTGKPVYPGIVWQCRRTAEICEALKRRGLEQYVQQTTGLRIDAYFSGTKIRWILDNVEGAKDAAARGELLFGTVDTWLLWRLTGGRVHATDRTNASRTMLYNIRTHDWDERLLRELEIPRSMLPEVRSSGEVYAEIDLPGARVPIAGIAGDQQAALYGQKCFEAGSAKNTYGTGCFLLMNIGEEPVVSRSGLLTTVAATEKGAPVCYALEGSVFIGGAVVQWLRDSLGLIRASRESEECAKKVPDSGGVYVVPAFAGLGAPYWDMYARGAIVGLTRGSCRDHIIRAALESIAYQTQDVLGAMEADVGGKLTALKADGGASANDFLMQFQADISDAEVVCTAGEATALGAAYLAGLATGFWSSRGELLSLPQKKRVFAPSMTAQTRKAHLDGWKAAVRQVLKNGGK
ncbi:MAG: glycerol kinase GlpK [Oscillospiraceae bacterium]|nr:glycerol kinase GlpK [Oscillospiraceae bacterium]